MNNNINEQIVQLKKINSRNTKIIVFLVGVLVFVCAMAIYVRFFG